MLMILDNSENTSYDEIKIFYDQISAIIAECESKQLKKPYIAVLNSAGG